jgi:tetratricopeptide (TPR) repeat protein
LGKIQQAQETTTSLLLQLSEAKLQVSSDYARCLELSAKIAEADGRHSDSLRLLGESIELEQELGNQNPEAIALRSKELIRAYVKDGNLQAASAIVEKALAVCEKELGPDDPETADLLSELAAIRQADGRHEEALGHLARAYPIHDKAAEGEPTAQLTRDLKLMAKSSQAMGNFDGAAANLKQAMYLTERQLSADPRETAAMLLQLGDLEIQWKRPSAAQEHLMQAIALLDRFQNKEYALAQEVLADFYFKSGRYAEIEPRLQKARHVWTKDMEANSGPLANNLRRHAEALDFLGRGEEAEFLRNQSAEISGVPLGERGGRPLSLHARVRLAPNLSNLHAGNGESDKADD